MADDATDAKIAAAEARTDTKFAAFQGRFDRFSDKLDSIAAAISTQRDEAKTNRTVIVTTMIGSVLAMAALVVGMLSFGAATFYNGTVLKDVAEKAVQEIQSKQLPPAK